jgi:hypothetical protein
MAWYVAAAHVWRQLMVCTPTTAHKSSKVKLQNRVQHTRIGGKPGFGPIWWGSKFSDASHVGLRAHRKGPHGSHLKFSTLANLALNLVSHQFEHAEHDSDAAFYQISSEFSQLQAGSMAAGGAGVGCLALGFGCCNLFATCFFMLD